jgi:hypothetical protein
VLTLLAERFAPTTSSIGFLQAPLEDADAAMSAWRRGLYPHVGTEVLAGDLPSLLARLEPLVGGSRPRELLVKTAGDAWTADFDCLLAGTDPVSFVGHMCRLLKCRGLAVRSQPHTIGTSLEVPGRYGAVQFELYGPDGTEFLNHIRSVSAAHDGSNWRFDSWGSVQPYEQVAAYRARRVRDRFTSDMLAAYCEAVGVRPFDPDFYLPHGILFESDVVVGPEAIVLSLPEVQHRMGLTPGLADRLPG